MEFPYNKNERLFQLQQILLAHPGGLTRADLSRRLNVHRSTITRYITDLSMMLPLWETENGRIGINPDAYLSSLGLNTLSRTHIDLSSLIAQGEGELLEFKVTACWDMYQNAKNSRAIESVIKSIVGFMNSNSGGTLLIGVSNDGNIVGLDNDYKFADTKKQNRDGFELYLRNSVNSNIGSDCIPFYNLFFHRAAGTDVCQVIVAPSSKPVFFRGEFYVRNGNQTRQLTTQEAIDYIKNRWR